MAGRKEYELLFKLQAALGGNFNSSFSKALSTTKELQGKLSEINSISRKIDGYQRQSDAVDKNREKLESLKKEHEKLQREMEQTEEPSEELRKKFQKNEKQIAATTTKIEDQERKLKSLGGELKDAGVDTDNLSASNAKLQKSYDKVKKSQEELAGIAAAQEKNAAAIAKTKAQLIGTVGAIAGLGAAFYAGPIKGAMEYRTALAKIGTIADTNAVPLSKMGKDVLKLSNQVGVNANDIAEDVYNAISAGQKTGDAVGFVSQATKLAKGGFAETSQTLDVLTTILNAYGLKATDAGKVSDILIQTQNKGKVTVAELASVMGKVIPTAKANNVALEQLSAGYAIMTSKGIDAAESTTYMNGMLNELGKTGSKSDKALRKVTGSSFKQLMASGKSVADVLKILQDQAENSGLSISDMFGSTEAGKAALSIMSAGVDGFNQSVSDMVNSSGAAEKAFNEMMDTPEEKVERAKNSISNLSKTLGITFLPSIGKSADKVSDLVTKLSEFAEENPELVKTITKVGAALAATAVGGQTAKLGFLKLKGGVLKVQEKFALLKEKIAESSAGAVTGGSKFAELGKKFSGYFGGVKNSLGGVDTAVSKFNFVKKLKSKFNAGSLGEAISGKISGVTTKILSPFQKMGGKLTGFLSPIGKNVTGIFGKIGGAIVNGPLGKIGGVFKSLGGVANSVLGPAVKGLGSVFGGLFGKVMPIIAIISLLSALFIKLNGGDLSGFIKPIQQAFEQAKPTLQAVMEQLKGLGAQIMPLLMNAAQQLAPLFGQLIAGLLPIAVEIIGQIVPLISQLVTQLLPVILNIITTIAPLLTQVITTILPVILQLLQTILPVITQLITEVLPIIVDILNQLLPIVTQIIQAVLPVIMTLLQALMPVITVLANVISSVLGAALQAVSPILNGLITILKGIISFITGVFTGNWKQAWEGVKSIFGGVFTSLVELVKAPFRLIVGVINGVIGGLNKLKIPDWVPGIGGKGINIPLIPTFAKGTKRTPDTFIAGEKGAELVTNARNRSVFTAAQTGNIFGNLARMANTLKSGAGVPALQLAYAGATTPGVNAPTVSATSPQESIVIHSAPVFHVGSDAQAQDIDEALKRHDEELLAEIEARKRKKEDDERRQKYD